MREMRASLGKRRVEWELASMYYALCYLVSNGYLRVKKSRVLPSRFFNVVTKLPPELQEEICLKYSCCYFFLWESESRLFHRIVKSSETYIPSRYSKWAIGNATWGWDLVKTGNLLKDFWTLMTL